MKQWLVLAGMALLAGLAAAGELLVKWQLDDGVPWEAREGVRLEVPPHPGPQAYRLCFEARAGGGTAGRYDHSLQVQVAVAGARRPFFMCGPYVQGGWESYEVTFPAEAEGQPGPVEVTVAYGWGSSDIEVRNAEVVPLAEPGPRTEWRRTGHWYAGQDLDAPWRARAREMIEANRMAELRVRVIDRDGQPVAGARVVLEQQAHAYQFGTAVATQRFGDLDHPDEGRRAEARRYFDEIVANFNYFVPENGLKMQAWANEWAGFRREHTLGAIDWLRWRGLECKGHVLVWPGWENLPAYMREKAGDPAALDSLMRAHIDDIGTALNGKAAAFDVLNEPFTHNDLMRILGDGVMAEWFKQAREVLPGARLCLNDFLLIANGGRYRAKLDYYEALVRQLLAADAPLDVIGFQNHYRHTFLTAPERIWELCDRFGAFGLPLECSEFDVLLEDEQLQADYTRDFMTAWFAHPATRAFMLWGFWEAEHWLPQAALITRDWRKKPNYHAYRDLVFKEWWSGWEEAETGSDGWTRQRVFHGAYKVSAVKDGITRELDNIRLGPAGLDLVIRL